VAALRKRVGGTVCIELDADLVNKEIRAGGYFAQKDKGGNDARD
jgi:hypothetical protein